MREVNPIKMLGIDGYYSTDDLRRQMIFYGDITAFRTARIMKVAEECAKRKRNVLVLTENQDVLSLANQGFLVYRPAAIGCNPEIDGPQIVAAVMSGQNIIVCTDRMQQIPKNALLKHILNSLAEEDLDNLSMGYDVAECYHPRKRNHNDSNGIATLNNLLKRGKADGAEFFFGAESPDEIAKEISESCGVPVVSLITNNSRAKKVSDMVDKRIWKYADEIFGIKALNENDFYLWNGHTAARQEPQQGELPIELNLDIQALTQHTVLPRWLKDKKLDCGYDPTDPRGTRTQDEADGQAAFLKSITEARDNPDAEAAAKTTSVRAMGVANDNPKPLRGRKRMVIKEGRQEAIERIRQAGVTSPERAYTLSRTILNSRPEALFRPADGRMTANSVATQVIENENLATARIGAFAYSQRLLKKKVSVSSVAYGAALYQAMIEDADLALEFHHEVAKKNLRSGERSQRALDLEAGLAAIAAASEGSDRAERQYQLVQSTWHSYRAANSLIKKAA